VVYGIRRGASSFRIDCLITFVAPVTERDSASGVAPGANSRAARMRSGDVLTCAA